MSFPAWAKMPVSGPKYPTRIASAAPALATSESSTIATTMTAARRNDFMRASWVDAERAGRAPGCLQRAAAYHGARGRTCAVRALRRIGQSLATRMQRRPVSLDFAMAVGDRRRKPRPASAFAARQSAADLSFASCGPQLRGQRMKESEDAHR